MVQSNHKLFGEHAIELGLISQEQLDECLRIQSKTRKAAKNALRIGKLLAKKEYLKPDDVARILTGLAPGAGTGKLFGELACYYRFCSSKQLQECLVLQQEYRRANRHLELGQIMIEQGLLKKRQVDVLLTAQHRTRTESVSAAPIQHITQAGIQPGKKVGPFQIKKQLGNNLLGVIFEATDTKNNRTVALQLLSARICNDHDHVKQIKDNLILMQRMETPHIRKAYSIETINESCMFLVLQFVDGQSLFSLISKKGSLVWEDAVKIILQAAEGLHDAHKLGLLHGDLRPSNFILDGKLNLVLNNLGMDSGVSEDLQKSSDTPLPIYTSPESLQSSTKPDHRSDIFSLGLVMHYMITGRDMLSGKDGYKTLLTLSKGENKLLQEHDGEIPEKLDRILLRMCHSEIDERYPRYPDLMADLQSVLRKLDSERVPSVILSDVGLDPVQAEAIRKVWSGDNQSKEKIAGPPSKKGLALCVMAILLLGIIVKVAFFSSTVTQDENQTAYEPFQDPEGSYREWMDYYEDISINDPDSRRKVAAKKKLRTLQQDMDAEAQLSFDSIAQQVQAAIEKQTFQAAIDIADTFSTTTYFTEQWQTSAVELHSTIKSALEIAQKDMQSHIDALIQDENWEEATSSLQAYLKLDHADLLATAKALQLELDTKQKEANAIIDQKRKRHSQDLIDSFLLSDLQPLLRTFSFMDAIKQINSFRTKHTTELLPDHVNDLLAITEETRDCLSGLQDLARYQSLSDPDHEIWIRHKGIQCAVLAMRKNGWRLQAVDGKPFMVQWQELEPDINFSALADVLIYTGDTEHMKIFSEYLLKMDAPLAAGKLGMALKASDELTSDLKTKLHEAGSALHKQLDTEIQADQIPLPQVLAILETGAESIFFQSTPSEFDKLADKTFRDVASSAFKGEPTGYRFEKHTVAELFKTTFGTAKRTASPQRLLTQSSTTLQWQKSDTVSAVQFAFQFPDQSGEIEIRLGDVTLNFKLPRGKDARLSYRIGSEFLTKEIVFQPLGWHVLSVRTNNNEFELLFNGNVIDKRTVELKPGPWALSSLGKQSLLLDYIFVWD